MTTTIIVIIILAIVIKFFIDRDKMIQKQVDTHGGMKQKYQKLIEGLSQGAVPEFCEVTRDHLYFRFVFGSQTASNYYITEQFSKVNIEWMLQMGPLGNRKLKWTFNENASQDNMLEIIATDVEKEVMNVTLE